MHPHTGTLDMLWGNFQVSISQGSSGPLFEDRGSPYLDIGGACGRVSSGNCCRVRMGSGLLQVLYDGLEADPQRAAQAGLDRC